MRRQISAILITTAIVATPFSLAFSTFGPNSLAAPATASAAMWPEDCYNAAGPQRNWFAICRAGTGHYKATVVCKPWDGGGLVTREPAVWQPIGERSIVWCPAKTDVSYGGILMKDD